MAGLLVVVLIASLTAVSCPVVTRFLIDRAVVDSQVGRSSHLGEIPRGGGLALAAGVLGAVVIGGVTGARLQPLGVTTFVLAGFAFLGFVDDLHSLRSSARLAVQLLLAGVFSIAVLPQLEVQTWYVGLGLCAFVVAMVNAFNFMDGINGISSMTSVVVAGSLAISSYRWGLGIEVPALAIVGAGIGFAPFNMTKRLFLGDVGSYLLGASLSVLAILTAAGGVPPLVVVLPFGIYVGDVGYTLARRAQRRAPVMQAHREHVYQRLANEGGWGHERTTLVVGCCTLVLVLVAQLAGGAGPAAAAAAITFSLLVVALYLGLPSIDRRLRT